MPDEISAFSRGEEAERDGDQVADVVKGSGPSRPKERFQFGEGAFDRIEVGAVRREKTEMGADGFDGGANRRLFVHREVVEHHDVARALRGDQDLFDIGAEDRIVDRSVEDRRCPQPLEPQRGNHGVRLPMAARCVTVQPDAARTAAIASQQVSRHATFIEKDVLAHIAEGLPCAPCRHDVRPSLFVGVYRFF